MNIKSTKGPTLRAIIAVFTFLLAGLHIPATAQVEVDINFDVKHSVGGEDSFNREKYIVIHADATESDYSRNPDRLNDLLVTYDAHYGRETGRMRFIGDNVFEDPDRVGFAEPDRILELGQAVNDSYLNDTVKHATEFQGRSIVAAQERPFFPNGQLTSPVPFDDIPAVPAFAFSISDDPDDDADFGTATGEFMGLFLRDAYGDGSDGKGPDGSLVNGKPGAPRPTWVEVINEPFFPLIDFPSAGEEATVDQIFELHRSVAREVKAVNPDLKVGGFTNAFPDLEWRSPSNNKLFSQWDERWKRFIDEVGSDMDFYSIHLYDFHSIGGGNLSNAGTPGSGVSDASREILRKGGNIEATLDMIEHYNTIRYGDVKPWLISEYGAQLNDFYGEFWSPQRDWFILKSFSSMMMQFMERPDVIEKTVPFVLARADFLFGNVVADRVYPWRMLRDENEAGSIDIGQIENSVFTEVIKFYQLWSDVNGTRIDTISSDLDVMVDAYVDTQNNKAYVILNSLDKADLSVNLNEFGVGGASISNVNVKHLFQSADGSPQLDDDDFAAAPTTVVVKAEGTMVVEYSFDAAPPISETAIERKVYATSYNQEIRADQTITFTVPGVTLGDDGESVLRLGLGRSAFLSRTPTVLVNNNPVVVPDDYRGDTQLGRDVFPLGENVFFSMLEIPVPYGFLIAGDNQVDVTFSDGVSDNSGAVSSLALQTFEFSREVPRTVAAAPNLPDRVRAISWDNVSAFMSEPEALPRFDIGDEENISVSWATGVANSEEEDLSYVATQIRQLDENNEIVATSAFNLAVPGAVQNVGSTTFRYLIPSNFATGPDNVTPFTDPIPESSDLPPNHSLVLVMFMATNDNTLFANANTEIMIGDGEPALESRERSITFNNIGDFIPDGASFPELGIGQVLNVNITYATGITNFVEEDLFYVASFIRQEDENGLRVADSAFTVVVPNEAADADTTTFSYIVPTNFAVDASDAPFTEAIPRTEDLPEGHQLKLILFISTNDNSLFADANTNITIGEPTDNSNPAENRARSISFDNIADFIPDGSTLPQVDIGESLDITVTYATAIAAGVEEDFAYIATQVRQLDESGAIVATSEFNLAVEDTAPNSGVVDFTYTIPTNFATGADDSTPFTDEIPDSVSLPDGHSLFLILFMSTNNNSFFVDANTEIVIGELPPVADRDRVLNVNNIADFIPVGQTLPQVDIGEALTLNVSYATGARGGVEEDLAYIGTQIRQLDESGNTVATSAFNTLVDGAEANTGTNDFVYTIPSNFETGVDVLTPFTGAIPNSADLPTGHSLLLILFMSTNDDSFFVDANTEILIGDPLPPKVDEQDDELCFPVTAINGAIAVICL